MKAKLSKCDYNRLKVLSLSHRATPPFPSALFYNCYTYGYTLGTVNGIGVCVSEVQSVRGVHCPVVGVWKWCIPSGNLSGLPDGICQVVSRVRVPLMSSESPPDFSSPALSTPSCAAHADLIFLEGNLAALPEALKTHLPSNPTI